jgi:hypothetical protein
MLRSFVEQKQIFSILIHCVFQTFCTICAYVKSYKHFKRYAGSEVLTAVAMKNTIFLHVTVQSDRRLLFSSHLFV